jgi:hypothetical protein
MAAIGAIWCRHLPDGGIQWLLVKPGRCSIRRCAPHELYRHIIAMVIEMASNSLFLPWRTRWWWKGWAWG